MKSSYKIPASLDTSYGDMTITIRTKEGLGLKPLPIKQIFFVIGVVFSAFFLQQKTFIGNVGTGASVAFLVLYIGFGLYLALMDSSHVLRFEMIPAMLSYLQPDHRKLNQIPISFYNVVDIDKDTGLIKFGDGYCGYIYSVVGSASILLFDSDKNNMLNRIDSFWQKQVPNAEFIFLTIKEPQKVTSQLRAIRDYDLSDDDLRMLAKRQDDILRNYVGNEFKSIQQYLIIKAPNKEELRASNEVLRAEYENSSYVFKSCRRLTAKESLKLIDNIM